MEIDLTVGNSYQEKVERDHFRAENRKLRVRHISWTFF